MRWWVVAAGVLALASCSDGDGETAVVEAGTAPPTAPENAAAPSVTTTTPPVPATEPSTTSTTTTSPPTTTTPPTTVDLVAALTKSVRGDFLETQRLTNIALADPEDAGAVSRALDRRTGPAVAVFDRYVASLREQGLATRENPSVRASHAIEVPPRRLVDNVDVVEFTQCEVDPWILVEVGAAPDGSDAVVDDNIYAYRTLVIMRRVDGTWLIEGANQLGEWVGVTECPD